MANFYFKRKRGQSESVLRYSGSIIAMSLNLVVMLLFLVDSFEVTNTLPCLLEPSKLLKTGYRSISPLFLPAFPPTSNFLQFVAGGDLVANLAHFPVSL